MQITRSSIDTQKAPDEGFTGDVYIHAVAAPAGSSTIAAAAAQPRHMGRRVTEEEYAASPTSAHRRAPLSLFL